MPALPTTGWTVDMRWRPDDERPEILRETIEWRVGRAESLVIDLPALFAEAFGE